MARRLSSDPMVREKAAGQQSSLAPAESNLLTPRPVDFGHCPVHHKWPHQINASVFICGAVP
jgi:hypothetical protein